MSDVAGSGPEADAGEAEDGASSTSIQAGVGAILAAASHFCKELRGHYSSPNNRTIASAGQRRVRPCVSLRWGGLKHRFVPSLSLQGAGSSMCKRCELKSVNEPSLSAFKLSFALPCRVLAVVDVAARGAHGARFIQKRCLRILHPLNVRAAKSAEL